MPHLAKCLHNSGVKHLVYKSNQEFSLRATIEKSLEKLRRTGQALGGQEFLQLVPEKRAVGESPSNGKAERAVQSVEDMVRTYLHAFESRIKTKLPTSHPVMRWMVEHAAAMLN